jgi:uncharacterized Zn finger protein
MLTSVLLPITPTSIIAGTPTEGVALTCIQACNNTNIAGTPQTLTLSVYAVPAGRSADATTLIYSEIEITAGDSYIVDQERMVLGNGDSIWAKASIAGALVFTVSSVGI